MKNTLKMLFAIALIAIGGVMMGCDDEPRIDASSEEAFEQSLEEMAEAADMDEEEEMEFGLAVLAVTMDKAGDEGLMGLDDDELDEEIMGELDGMTVDDVMEAAEESDFDTDDPFGFGDMDMDMELDDDFDQELEIEEDIEVELDQEVDEEEAEPQEE